MARNHEKSAFQVACITILAFIAAYYSCILLHEWGHGAMAWLLGQKSNPFDIEYGGWALLHVDEAVDYKSLHANRQGLAEALIGISGLTVTILFFILSLILLSRPSIQKRTTIFTFFYWTLAINTIPLLQYLSLTTFSNGGDVGHFIHGLNISPWWLFIPGTLFVIAALWRIFRIEIPRAYAVIPIRHLYGQRLFLLATLIVIFLLIYSHGYNPLTDQGTIFPSKLLSLLSLLLVPVLFLVCDPSRSWVKKLVLAFADRCA